MTTSTPIVPVKYETTVEAGPLIGGYRVTRTTEMGREVHFIPLSDFPRKAGGEVDMERLEAMVPSVPWYEPQPEVLPRAEAVARVFDMVDSLEMEYGGIDDISKREVLQLLLSLGVSADEIRQAVPDEYR